MNIVAFTLTSPLTQTSAPFKIGQVFRKGDVPNGSYVVADIPNCSVTPKRTWNDGSLKHAIVSGLVNLTANVPKQITLSTTQVAPTGTPLTIANLRAAIATQEVATPDNVVKTQFGALGTVSLSAIIAQAPKRVFVATPEMFECHYSANAGSDPSLYNTINLQFFSNGSIYVRTIGGNGHLGSDYLQVADRVQKNYIPTVTIGGVVVWNNGGVAYKHSPNARWDVDGWIGVDPQITPRHDMGYLNRTKMVPNYWKKTTLTPTQITFWNSKNVYTPGSTLDFTESMGATGFQDQIGLLPLWDALCITSEGHPVMYKAVVAHARAINSYPIAYVEKTTRDPIRITDWPNWTLQGPNAGGSPGGGAASQTSTTNIVWEAAHFPSSGYLAYLLTGDYYFLEAACNTAIMVFLCSGVGFGLGVNRTFGGQNRARGWANRAMSQAAAIYPDDLSNLFGSLSVWMQNYCDIKATELTTGATAPWLGYDSLYNSRLSDGGGLAPGLALNGEICAGTAPWEHHFTTQAMGMASDIEPCSVSGMVNVNRWRDYLHGAPVWIMGGTGSHDYNFGFASAYTISFRISTIATGTYESIFHTRWCPTDGGQIFSDTWSQSPTAPSPNPGTNTFNLTASAYDAGGYFSNLLPALAYAVDHGKPGAAESWARFIGSANFATTQGVAPYDGTPIWGIVPRSYVQPAIMFEVGNITPIAGTASTKLATGKTLYCGPSLKANRFVVGNRGTGKVLGSELASTGANGPSIGFRAITPAMVNKVIRVEITNPPLGGKLVVNDDTSFTFTDANDGSYSFGYLVKADNVIVVTGICYLDISNAGSVQAAAVKMTGKNLIVSGHADLKGDATATAQLYLDPQPSGTPLGPFVITPAGVDFVHNRTFNEGGKWKARTVAVANGATTSVTNPDLITVVAAKGNPILPFP